jgi:hypothetical protein
MIKTAKNQEGCFTHNLVIIIFVIQVTNIPLGLVDYKLRLDVAREKLARYY